MTNFEDIIVNTSKEGEKVFSQKNFIKLSVREIMEKIEKWKYFMTQIEIYIDNTHLESQDYIY